MVRGLASCIGQSDHEEVYQVRWFGRTQKQHLGSGGGRRPRRRGSLYGDHWDDDGGAGQAGGAAVRRRRRVAVMLRPGRAAQPAPAKAGGAYRHLTALGVDCVVAARSLIPRKPGDRVKTNRRDAEMLARTHRAGELTAVWVPDADHEAMRDLVRAREAAVRDVRKTRQRLSGFPPRHGRVRRRKTWTRAHRAGMPISASRTRPGRSPCRSRSTPSRQPRRGAIAREMAAFVWAIAQQVAPTTPSD